MVEQPTISTDTNAHGMAIDQVARLVIETLGV
jgi:hypothetical protein